MEVNQDEPIIEEPEEEVNRGNDQAVEEQVLDDSSRKRKRTDYDADDEESEACSHYTIKR